MRFSIATTLAFATTILAQTPFFAVVSTPTKGEKVPAGAPYTIKWAASDLFDGTVQIVLIGGKDEGSLNLVETLGSGIEESAGTFEWAVAKTLTAPLYGLKIISEKNSSIFQYSFPFTITGGSAATSGSASSSSASVSKSSSVSSTIAPSSESSAAVSTTTSASSTLISPAPSGNLSISRTTATTTTLVSSTSRTGTSTTSSSTSGATAFVANSFAMVGGFAMAMLAL